MRRATLAALLGAILVSAGASFAQPGPGPRVPGPQLSPPPITSTMSHAALKAELDTWLSGLAMNGMFSGAILVARDGKEIYTGAYGLADRAAKTAPTADTPFNFGSIGKVITQTAVMQLADAGKLQLADTVGKWLPDYPQAATRSATIDQLINHRGGVPDFFGPKFQQAHKTQFTDNHAYYAFVSTQPPLFPPGEREEYCNGCYAVLGEIIAKVSGKTYEAYVRDNIFAKAGMTHSAFTAPAGAARPYGKPRPDAELQDVSGFHGAAGSAAGGSYSTVRDLAAFDDALRNNKLTSAKWTATVLRGEPAAGRSMARLGIAGGAPGVNGLLIGNGVWTIVGLANLDPPAAEASAATIFRTLAGPPPQKP